VKPEEAQYEHHDYDEADKVNDAVHSSGPSYLANNPDPDCVCSNLCGAITLANFARFRDAHDHLFCTGLDRILSARLR